MPEDTLFTEGSEEPQQQQEPQEPPKLPDLDEKLAGLQGALDERLSKLEQAIQWLAQNLQQQPQQQQEPSQQTDIQDPDQYVKQKALEAVKPDIDLIMQDRQIEVMQRIEDEVKREFGEDVWEELVKEPFQQALQLYEPRSRASYVHARVALQTILGRPDVIKRIMEIQEKRRAQQKQGEEPPEMLLGGRMAMPRRAGQLSPEEREFLMEWEKRTGEKVDPKEYIRFRDLIESEMDLENA